MQTLYIHLIPAGANTVDQHGIYRYAESARILMFGFAFNDGEIELHDCTAQLALPGNFIAALQSATTFKVAHDANLTRALIKACWQIECPTEQWRCSAVLAKSLAIPATLELCMAYLKLPAPFNQDGRRLCARFCKPQAESKQQRKIWVGQDDFPADWLALKHNCRTLTAGVRAVYAALRPHDLSPLEWQLWHLDQRSNDIGVRVDLPLVAAAIKIAEQCSRNLLAELTQMTGIRNPNSDAQIQKWLFDEHDEVITALNKDTLPAILQRLSGDPKRALEIRQALRTISLQKLHAVQRSVSQDGRVRGLLQFLGAHRTGRWSGRVVQIQNLPKSHIKDIALAQRLVRAGEVETLELLYGSAHGVLSELLRTVFIASPGTHLVISDFSSIEARILAWGAGESWRLEVFRSHGKIYEASASQMFGIPVDRIVPGNPEYALRQKGKVAELALGYAGSSQALIMMGALKMGLSEADLPTIVTAWRRANPAITAFWRQMERDAMTAVETQSTVGRFSFTEDFLFMNLPSGRRLSYPQPRISTGKFGPVVEYWGKHPDSHQWGWRSTYGGKMTENWCQAVARDVLREAMFAVQSAGFGRILFTVHDEIVLEGQGSAAAVESLMSRPISWAPNLPLEAKGFISPHYSKA